jgi:sulfate/thiosulfate-binding protein
MEINEMKFQRHAGFLTTLFVVLSAFTYATILRADQTISNVSYDPTREFYAAYDKAFAAHWQSLHHENVTVDLSNGGSGKQAQSVINGNPADVVTLGLAYDIDAIEDAGLISPGWENKFPDHSTPYTSTIVFLVRKGNLKNIKDWPDLVKPGVQIITSNPKSSGGARWAFLAAYGYELKASHGNQYKAKAFVKALYANVPILPSGARGATDAFVQQEQGDVLLSWENEALLTVNKLAPGQYEIVRPSISVLAEPPVAVVDKNVDAHGTRAVAEAYLKWLYSPEGQRIAADNYYRPRLASAAAAHKGWFPTLKLFDITFFGDWRGVQKEFFSDGGVFDQIYAK